MPDRRRHRGPHPEDSRLFAADAVGALAAATSDLCWLLTRGYASKSALKVVGDRHGLDERQRTAVLRASCRDAAAADRRRRCVEPAAARGLVVWIDGFNLVTTLEAALAGGVLLACRDGCLRDMASMHGSYRKVEETVAALELAGAALERVAPREVVWWLDRPVSNSGRLAAMLREHADAAGLPWRAELDDAPDRVLRSVVTAEPPPIVVSADSHVLDGCADWINLARRIVEARIDAPWIVDLERVVHVD